jgi:carbonic anhydrase
MKKILLALSVSALLTGAVQAAAPTASAPHWTYTGEHGPEHWNEVSETCGVGKNQSPINLTDVAKATLAPLDLTYGGMVTELTNNGHSLQATVTGNNTLVIDGVTFELKQFHFHTPSENVINNHQFPLEGHFVHADKDGNLAVVAVMFEMGGKNPELAKLTANLPKSGETVKLAQSFPVKDLLPSVTNYYRFNGSLTTPPCSEGVRWIVLKETKTLSDAQDKALMGMMGHNNRPVQSLNARKVLSN